ncbi:MAG: hypothetical protein WBF13_08425 [Candidatus Zixiibacteriota bacterium]
MRTRVKETPDLVNDERRGLPKRELENVLKFKKRMLEWSNPVEYVNNMYGCHPDDDDNEYFKRIFAK